MKTKLHHLFFALVFSAGVHQTAAQLPVISSFSQNGVLVCTNLAPGTVASVQWASSPSGPWQSNWAGLTAVTVGTNASIQVSVPMFYRVLGVANNMALIPAGSFTMGDSLDGETDATPAVSVYVSAFYMDMNLVTLGQWVSVYKWATNAGYGFDLNMGVAYPPNSPLSLVNWYDCVKWCNARSQQEGLTPVYYTDANLTQVYQAFDIDAVYANWTANGYRLPTEAEWEKAARGGLSGHRFPWGDTISETQANYRGDTNTYSYDLGPNGYNAAFADVPHGIIGSTSPVGYFAPNGYGLYDMAGNVFEWCWDWYAGPPYPNGSPYLGGTDPRGPEVLYERVWRGGSWGSYASWARCANRFCYGPDYFEDTGAAIIGFRCVRGVTGR